MDETLLGLMEIVGPIILLVLLIWVVLRSRSRKDETPMSVTERATREEYADEEQMRREGTDDR
jgi:cytochrome c-type biogenesis protein CcmH/NrfF